MSMPSYKDTLEYLVDLSVPYSPQNALVHLELESKSKIWVLGIKAEQKFDEGATRQHWMGSTNY